MFTPAVPSINSISSRKPAGGSEEIPDNIIVTEDGEAEVTYNKKVIIYEDAE